MVCESKPIESKTQDKEEKHLEILLVILGIFSGIWIWLIQTIVYFAHKQAELPNPSTDILMLIILLSSFQILSYIVSVVKAIFFETVFYGWIEVNINKLNSKRRDCYIHVMNDWTLSIFAIVSATLIVVYKQLLGTVGAIVGLVLIIILAIELYLLLINPLLKKKYKVTDWNSFVKIIIEPTKPKFSIGTIASFFWKVTLVVSYLAIIIAFTSGVNITLDKERYSTDENVVAHIQPYGIVPPKINYIRYSNDGELLYNGTNAPFPSSLRIIQIPAEILTNDTYNSFLAVSTLYISGYDTFTLGDIYFKIIPVYTPIKNRRGSYNNTTNASVDVNLNLTIDSNSSVNSTENDTEIMNNSFQIK